MANTGRSTVLVVDDTSENIDVLKAALEEAYIVKACVSGLRAIEIALSSEPPDLILLDVVMPGMDGFETCRRIKNHQKAKRIPVLFVTASGDIEDESMGFEAGGVDYITKPISPAVVQARVRTHLALYDQNRMLEEMVRERTKELDQSRYEIIQRLSNAAEYRDEETGRHILRMSKYCEILAEGMGLDAAAQIMVLHSSPMHDIGKIGIPDRILSKEGPLDEEEWKVMKTHPAIGVRIIRPHRSELLRMAAKTALTHHERWDGSGYPQGIQRKEIPLVGRIAAVADVFDALTSKRPYKEIWPLGKAIDHITAQSGLHFDPDLVTVFLKRLALIEAVMINDRD